MAGSIVVALRKAITEGLTVLTAPGQPLENVEVAYYWRAGVQAREQIFTQRPRADTPAAAMRAGRNHRDETGTVEVVVLVEAVGEQADVADERALQIGTVVEEWFADRKSNEVGVLGLNWMRLDSWTLANLNGDNSSFSELIYTLRYNARLT